MLHANFTGTGVALITPFNADLEIDFNSLERIIQHLISNGINYLVVLGTTAESATLTEEEKKSIIQFVKEKVDGRIPLVLGAGGNDTRAVVEFIKQAETYDYDAYLSVAPYYNKPNQHGLYAHFDAIANATNKPIILYNVPGRTSSNISVETVLALSEQHAHIIAVKEASGSVEQSMGIIQQAKKDFAVISGDDALTLALMSCGAKGVISVIAHAYPKVFGDIIRESLRGNISGARAAHYQILNITNAIYDEGNPTGIKYVLSKMGLCENYLRLPLVEASETLKRKIDLLLTE